MFILQLVSELNRTQCLAVKHESLLREDPGETQCALVSLYRGIKSNKTTDEGG